ncbi:N5-carboxyaminoimidazole ribonucleotide mutase [bioreactor metagenome]|uniref:N5-carboxyaminoimidazole ribonucleotide mutase n=1 Tax=bioreactor metagenome TaxID=1076179 RepID=A0A645IV10_9ZZZZ
MPKGVPVATVAVDGAENAAILAVQMLSLRDARLREAVKEYKEKIHDEVLESEKNLLRG